LKGVLAVWLARRFGFSEVWAAGAGAAAVLGHVFPAYLGFRGGKGVATAAGVFLALSPPVLLLLMALFVVVVAQTRHVSLGSIVSAVAFPVLLWLFCGRRWIACPPPGVYLTVCLISLVVVARHAGNLRRLLRGTERRLGERPVERAETAAADTGSLEGRSEPQ
jgi:acyl phosphate:glycerol-3-phosphate acyltransferase